MRILYKALASVGMIALSAAAAIGIRHLRVNSQKKQDDHPEKAASGTESSESKDQVNAAESKDQADVPADHPDQPEASPEAKAEDAAASESHEADSDNG